MSIPDWATTLSGFGAVLVGVLTVLHWLVKNYLVQLKENGGSSIKDNTNFIPDIKKTIDYIHEDVMDIKIKVAKLEGRFDQHVSENVDQ